MNRPSGPDISCGQPADPAVSGPAGLAPDRRNALAADLRLLAWLLGAERRLDLLLQLAAAGFPNHLALRLADGRGEEARRVLNAALQGLAAADPQEAQDQLDADYAGIYLNHSYRAAPTESVWLDNEQLAMQEAMFAVREWYRRFDLASADWRRFPDDHLYLQLQFVAELLERGHEADAARFLDEHLLLWVGKFAERVAARCATAFHAGLAMLTAAYAEQVRDVLAAALGLPPPQQPAARRSPTA